MMTKAKGYVYLYNIFLKQAYFVAKFESIADANYFCKVVNSSFYQQGQQEIKKYIFTSSKLEKSKYGDWYNYEE